MAPFYTKAVVWTNVEDEILRAAISKYGLNQWSRVSSLLARKTAKQAKARWMEWLNPSIKKIEWSRDEDEKLLHLAKLMPTQWRTIAPIVGRTATQCIERYQQLLEDTENEEKQGAQGSELALVGVGAESSAPQGAPRKRIGDIDPTPESKPARPDAVDMDEDELEMLSEARARLANTQGKKAKRKDRERLLEESRRLATLQKRRELKLAGINTKITKRNRNQVDYNADIPFEHKPAPGFYDTTEENVINYREKMAFERKTNKKGVFMQESLDKDQKNKKRYRDKDTAALAAEQAAQARAERLQELNHADKLAKRRKLVLPTPQVQDEEIEKIVKFGSRGEKVHKMYQSSDGGATEGLMSEYQNESYLSGNGSESVPQITAAEGRVLQSVKELKAVDNQLPLLGQDQEISTESSVNFDSVTEPTSDSSSHFKATRRDALGVTNNTQHDNPQISIRRKFQNLPKPVNNYELMIPEEQVINEDDYKRTENLKIDQGEIDAETERKRKETKERELKARSQVLAQNLPRPFSKNVENFGKPFQHTQSQKQKSTVQDYKMLAADMIQQEMKRLIISDSIKYPENKETSSGKADKNHVEGQILQTLDSDVKAKAAAEIEKEVADSQDTEKHIPLFVKQLEKQEFVLPGLDLYTDDEDNNDTANTKAFATKIQNEISVQLSEISTQSNDIETKLKKTMGGYLKRQEILSSKLSDAFQAFSDLQVERVCENSIFQAEQIAIGTRMQSLQEEADFLADAERKGQDMYQYYQSLLRT